MARTNISSGSAGNGANNQNGGTANRSPRMPVLIKAAGFDRTLDARPDTPDFRDKIYQATLVEVPPVVELDDYRKKAGPDAVLDQGEEGACTGFGLAALANYLLRNRSVRPDPNPVSARMFYEMARRYDEWPGIDYSGSSARGAMKGWHKHGVCADSIWQYDPNDPRGSLNSERSVDANLRPLGAYYRVNHKDLICMHTALAEVGILYATAEVHQGWREPDREGIITRQAEIIGGHAFAIVAYDRSGFWIQNSWGERWGKEGFCHISYDDWLANGTDVWVGRLGAPVDFGTAKATAKGNSRLSGLGEGYTSAELRPHIISLGNDGQLQTGGTYGKTAAEVKSIFTDDFKEITRDWDPNAPKRILLYAHGGLVDEASAAQRVAEYRATLLDENVYPLSFIWHSDFWSTLKNIISEALGKRRPEGFFEKAKEFMEDRVDDALEPVARVIGGKAQWDEMKENALAATTTRDGGARLVAQCLAELIDKDPQVEIHMIGHSAGSIFHAPLIQFLTGPTGKKIAAGPLKGKTGLGQKIKTCTLWAPACTIDLFKEAYVPSIKDGSIGKFTLFTLTDRAERDDNCASIYKKSLLYLCSNAFEEKARIPLFRDGWPILGMSRFVSNDAQLKSLCDTGKIDWIRSPNSDQIGSADSSRSTSHGGFDDDEATLKATLARITGKSAAKKEFIIIESERMLRNRVLGLESKLNLLVPKPRKKPKSGPRKKPV